MMTDAQTAQTALDKLIEAVEAGGDWIGPEASRALAPQQYVQAINAYGEAGQVGSLDAALALHESLLPGWDWWVNSHTYWDKDEGPLATLKTGTPAVDLQTVASKGTTPARAWLLAILRAYRSGEPK